MSANLKHLARRVLPNSTYRALGSVLYNRFCPICQQGHAHFRVAGDPPRKEALCISCGALERHRLVWLFFARRTDLFDGRAKRFLHVAPEPSIGPRIAALGGIEYTSADFEPGRAMVQMDITAIQYPENHFDVIYCSHVLEHVPNDCQAMREFYRVLKPGGWAILQVPITADRTVEDPSVTDPGERKRLFGQEDHVRRYGPDYRDRLSAAGFDVHTVPCAAIATEPEIQKHGLDRTESIFHCMKHPRATTYHA
jgi:SAM-dependent methyltransferase